MPSPFPGMDPYLEGYLWPDFHHRIATEITRQLAPRIRPRYVARLEVSVVEDPSPEAELAILYPDVEVLSLERHEASAPAGLSTEPEIVAPLILRILDPVDVRLVTVEIRDAGKNRLVTSIEILSPVNKREPGLTRYRRKQRKLRRAGVHVLEVDLLRRGFRPIANRKLPDAMYFVALTRSGAGTTGIWPLTLRDPLPRIPVPLLAPDSDVPLDLGAVIRAIYEEAGYDLSVDYSHPPPPPEVGEEDRRWLAELLTRSR